MLIQQLQRLWNHLSIRRRIQFIALAFLMIFSSLSEVITIGAIFPFLGILTSPKLVFNNTFLHPLFVYCNLNSDDQILLPVTIFFIVAILLATGMRFIVMWALTKLGFAIGSDLSSEVYRRTLYQPYQIHISRNTSEIIDVISNKISSIIYQIILPLLTTISSVLMIVIVFIALLSINTNVLLVGIAGFAMLYYLIARFTKQKLAKNSKIISRESNQLIKVLQEGLGGIRDILIDGSQATYYTYYRHTDISLRRAQSSITIIAGTPKLIVEAIGISLFALCAYYLVHSSNGLAETIPVLGTWALGVQRILPILHQAFTCWSSLMGAKESLNDTLNLLDQPLPNSSNNSVQTPLPFETKIVLNNLSFRYMGSQQLILNRISLAIPKGSKVGFIGDTGSGKSTLIDIIMGLLEPEDGTLFIDDTLVNATNVRSWQLNIAHVPQFIFLTDSTITENIAFGVEKESIDFERVKFAAEKAKIADTIDSWNKKYDTIIGERGVRLSGGQRQRIGIARALYKKSSVIIFDEATSSLDSQTETEVMSSLDDLESGLTILMVAHRVTTLRNCDLIIKLEKGQIKQIGTFAELIKL